MRYNQEQNTASLTLEQPQPSNLLNIYQQPVIGTTAQYSHDAGHYYHQPTPPIFPTIDARPTRLSSSAIPSTGIGQGHRSTTLPSGTFTGSHMSTRDQYATALPSYRRTSDFTRSPSYVTGALPRRVPISPSPTVVSGFGGSINRMESSQRFPASSKGSQVPPMDDTQSIGTLQYVDGNSPIKATITGVIDKGFFLSEDNEWTCYRRNYFSCNCSYSLSPYYPGAQIQYLASPNATPAQVFGFAMCISAVVSDSDQHNIELVQHTPKRDKGPTANPSKVPLLVKQDQQPVHSHAGATFGGSAIGRGLYSDGYNASGQAATSLMAEHTFERIQFKQATQNNGKRRAAQQYYHLIVELWADLGGQGNDQYVKVAFRKSAKMIVRGRSPGHYQNERRASQSNPPPSGSAGNLGTGYAPVSSFYEASSSVPLGNTSHANYDARGGTFSAPRRHALPAETPMTSHQQRDLEGMKGYSYFPGAATDGHTDDRSDAYDHQSHSESMQSHLFDTPGSKVKSEYDNTLPRLMHPPVMPPDHRQRCGPFDAKPTSNGYYPSHMMSPSNMSITMS